MENALSDINLSITLDPYNGWAYRNKGIYYLMTKKYEDALRLLQRAESIDPFIEKIYFYLGDAYYKNGNRKQGCIHYATALERNEIDLDEYEVKCN